MMDDKKQNVEAAEAELEHVLRNFRQSVNAWSEAEYGRPRIAAATVHHSWRIAAAWALGCALAISGLSAGLYERHHQKELANSNSTQQQHGASAGATTTTAEKTSVREVQVASVSTDEPDMNLLTGVDNDVSRQVPSAMEPLAQLMEDSSIR